MTPRVLFIGLDAAESTLVERWSAEGHLPAFADLSARGTRIRLANSLETLPGAIWPEITSGRSCGSVPLYYHPVQLRTGEARMRRIAEHEVDPSDYFWNIASEAGCRVAAIDIPQSVRNHEINGVQVMDWGSHDQGFETASVPPDLIEEIRARYGNHPVESCDAHGETEAGYDKLLQGLFAGADLKTEILLDLLDREQWDLFACAYGEAHSAGHHFWHFGDPGGPNYDPRAPKRFQTALRDVYKRVDDGIGRILERCDEQTTALVLTSHGMGPYIGGPHLLREFLARIGMSSARENAGTRALRRAHNAARLMPRGVKARARAALDLGGFRRAQRSIGASLDPLESGKTRAAALYNNRCGAIRINIRGREPFGCVEPGTEAAELIEEIRSELISLRDPESGEPIIRRVISAEQAFGSGHHPDVPDLMVLFRDDIGTIEACESPRAGTIRIPLYTNRLPRSADHTTNSQLWIKGPGVPAGLSGRDANVLDLAPTMLDLLGVPQPPPIDGCSLLAGVTQASAAGN